MKKYYILILIFLRVTHVFAQENPVAAPSKIVDQTDKIRVLTIGEKVPDINLHKILNYKDSSASLSDFYKGKLLIIDFWATWCPPCIESIPILDSIHKAIPDEINIITVTYQKEDIVQTLLKRNKIIGSSTLPFVVEDKILSRYFPHKFVPHEVWIDSSGIVRAITEGYQVTEESISRLLNNKQLTLLTKKDSLTYDPRKYSNFQKKDIRFRSVLAKTPLGIGGGWIDYKYLQKYNRYYKRGFWTHRVPIQLFYAAYTYGRGHLNLKRVFFNFTDSSSYLFPTEDKFAQSDSLKMRYTSYKQWLRAWEEANDYCYELITPDYVKDTLFFKYMLEDLNRGFDIIGTIEKRPINCIVIKLADPKKTNKLKTNGLRPQLIWSANHDTLQGIQNEPLSVLVSELNSYKKNDPVVDLTQYTKPVDLVLNISNSFQAENFDINELKKALAMYGLEVVREKRAIDVLVISRK